MSTGHSEPFDAGVHARTHEPAEEQNVSAQPGWSGHTEVHAVVHTPALHDRPEPQSDGPVQWSPMNPGECGAHTLALTLDWLNRVSVSTAK